MISVEIFEGDDPQERSVNGRTYREQTAHLHVDGSRFPKEFKVNLPPDAPGYSPGKYTLDSSSFEINKYGGLEINRYRLRLSPLAVRAAKTG